jgi:hypothetical protein
MKDMLCINAEQCSDDVVIVHDGDVQITLTEAQEVTLKAVHCTGTLWLRANPGPYYYAFLDVSGEVQCNALAVENCFKLTVKSLTLHSPIPSDWRIEIWRCEETGDVAVFIHPPAPQPRITVEDALVLSPWPVQLPQPAWHCSCVSAQKSP